MTQFQAVRRQTLADFVYEQLQTAIVRGDFADGDELNQVALAEQFGVSRVPVREALWRLQAERLVVAAPQQRFTVARLTPDEVIELTEIREELEVFALKKRMSSATPAELNVLRRTNDGLERLDDAEWLVGDRAFHRLVIGEGTPVAGIIDSIRVRIHRYLRVVVSSDDRRVEARNEHARVIEAMSLGDVRAAENALREHIGATRAMLQERMHGTEGLERTASRR